MCAVKAVEKALRKDIRKIGDNGREANLPQPREEGEGGKDDWRVDGLPLFYQVFGLE